MGSSSGSNTQTESTEPWVGVQGDLKRVFRNARQLYGDDPINQVAMTPGERRVALRDVTGGPSGAAEYADYLDQYGAPGQDVVRGAQLGMVPFTDAEIAAQQGLIDYAGSGLPTSLRRGQAALGHTLSGQYLDEGNPYLDQLYQSASRPLIEDFNTEILPAITGQFAGAGRYGSGAHENVTLAAADDLERNLAAMSANLYGSDYEAERGRMMQAMGLAPGYGTTERQIDVGNLGLLGDVGAAQRELAGQMLTLPDQAALEPWQRLMLYNDALGAGTGFGTTTMAQPYHQNKTAGVLGGAAAGAGTGAMVGSAFPGYGTIIGAGVGALAGGLGGYYG